MKSTPHREFVGRLLRDQEQANASWAHFIALDRAYSERSSPLKASLDSLALPPTLHCAADAYIRDPLLALLRLTDDPGRDRISLCGIAKLLHLEEVRTARISYFERSVIPCGRDCL